ncbi:hypothetical protein Asppvi_010777 [Aspergillus pseudoviridinutans]|uniref:Uncharacterized protein n=1 Tax=Aspergillus pseudoviridinutans TaxID=1517512 RepID=A0A9P3BJZ9_9EURO|nr:uncharacterized protein Asppvi_010777 [Aspergillus pseudoviridinutans]GIJ91804.1 hypothetical protein Asppvi_010777 [Aspergillus pseudoviridinutans]
MFMFKSILLLSAVSLPFGSAAPADNAVLAAPALPLDDSADSIVNITRRGVTTNPAVMYTRFGGTTCGTSCGSAYCTDTTPDATCIEFSAGSIVIDEFFGNCRFSKFAYTNQSRKIMEDLRAESLDTSHANE